MSQQTDTAAIELRRARELCALRRYADANATLDKVLASNPENSDAWCLRAVATLGLSDADSALDAAKHALALTPEAEWPHRLASIALTRLKKPKEAAWHAREAVRLDPHGWRSHAHLARTLASSKRDLADARAAADRALALAPHDSEAHIAAGAVAAAQGRRSDAEAAFRQALAIDPQNSSAHNELARLSMRSQSIANPGGLADAATGFATAVSADPRAAVSRHNLDLTLRAFLSRVAYYIFLDAYFVMTITVRTSRLGGRLFPVAALAIPAIYATRFITRLTPALRRHLRDLVVHDRKIRPAVALESLAAVCLIAAAITPNHDQHGLTGASVLGLAGALAALVGRLILAWQKQQSSRAAHGLKPRIAFGNPVLYALTGTFLFTAALTGYTAATSRAASGAGIAAAVCAAGAIATSTVIVRRRSQR